MTVVAPHATDADALATACSILPASESLARNAGLDPNAFSELERWHGAQGRLRGMVKEFHVDEEECLNQQAIRMIRTDNFLRYGGGGALL